MRSTSTGDEGLDRLLEGGYERDCLTVIYGPAGTGKTNLCLLCTAKGVAAPAKILWVDTDGSFSIERLRQITPAADGVLERTTFFRPATFAEQRKAIDAIRMLASERVGLIVIDSIATLYRLTLNRAQDPYHQNRELGLQLSYLVEIARKHAIPILITTQVYADLGKQGEVRIVGGDIIRYAAKCLIELRRVEGERKLVLRKHRSLGERELPFSIVESGISAS